MKPPVTPQACGDLTFFKAVLSFRGSPPLRTTVYHLVLLHATAYTYTHIARHRLEHRETSAGLSAQHSLGGLKCLTDKSEQTSKCVRREKKAGGKCDR